MVTLVKIRKAMIC